MDATQVALSGAVPDYDGGLNIIVRATCPWKLRLLVTVAEGIARARAMLGEECSILYLPEGPYVVPVLSEALREGPPTGLS